MDLIRKELGDHVNGGISSSSKMRKEMNGVVAAAPFLVKTHRMVEEVETDDVISWGETGKSFVVWKTVEFARDLLPAHFKHNNFSSFVRQLNTYGFRKIVPDRWEFANDNFQKGEQRLLNQIRRRKSSPPAPLTSTAKSKCRKNNATTTSAVDPSASNSGGELQNSSSTSSPPPPSQQEYCLMNLSDENKKLKKENHILRAEVSQSKKHCEELLRFLSKNAAASTDVSLMIKEAERIGVVEIASREEEEKVGVCLKLFGVLLEGEKGKKRGRGDGGGGDQRSMKKMGGFRATAYMGNEQQSLQLT